MAKTRRGFDDSLTLISLFGFLAIALNSFSTIDLSPWTTSVIMVIAGAGLMLEGNILSIRRWASNGIQKLEVPFLLSIIFGAFTIIVGILAMPSLNLVSASLKGMIGFVSIFAMIFISLQRWFID